MNELTPRSADLRSDMRHQIPIDEAIEFARLDALSPVMPNGIGIAWQFEGAPITPREKRWLELYEKHRVEIDRAGRIFGNSESDR